MRKKFKKFIKKNYFPYIMISLFSFLLILVFRNKYILGDDTFFHLSNIDIIKQNIFKLTKIRPIIANNYGYGIGIFYPQLPHILTAFIYYIGSIVHLSIFSSMKIMKFIITLSSGIFMYIYTYKIFKNKVKAFLASLSYITSSYFIIDIFYRDAFNESFMFIYIPMIFLGIHYLLEEDKFNKFLLFFVLGYVLAINSHLVLSVWLTIYILIYLLFNIKKVFEKKNIKSFIIASIFILLLTLPFTIPLIEHTIIKEYFISFINYKTNNLNSVSLFEFIFITPKYTSRAYFFIYLSYITVIGFMLSFIKLITEKKNKNRKRIIIFLILSIIGLFFSCCSSIYKILPNVLSNIQFAWRNVLFVLFFITIFSIDGLDLIYNKIKKKYHSIYTVIITIFIIAHAIISLSFIKLYKNIDYSISTHGMGWDQEYLPIEMLKDKDNDDAYINSREDGIIIINGNADINIISNDVPILEFTIDNIDTNVEIELPRLYYLGYRVKDSKGNEIKYNKDNNGFISLNISSNDTYKLDYVGTNGYKVSIILTTISFVVYISLLIYNYKKTKKKD